MYYARNYCPLLGTGAICIGFFGMQVIGGGLEDDISPSAVSVNKGTCTLSKL